MADEARDAPPTASGHVLVSGGGSGGHVFPALAIGEALLERGWRVSFAGDPRGMEARLIAQRGHALVPFPARGVVGRGALERLAALATLVRSGFAARRWVRRNGVDAAVTTGGYASVPAALGAAWSGRPLVLVEPNVRAGAANRWLSKRARVAAIAHAGTASDLRCPSFVAGVPVRPELFEVAPLAAAAPPRLLVLGGSQGARGLNRRIVAAAPALLERLPDLTILLQCGERWIEETRELAAGVAPAERARLEIAPFVVDVAGALASASLVASRAGAITLAELCAAGRPAVLFPLALAGGHQRANAEALAAAGAADVLDLETTTPGQLEALLGRRLAAPGELAAAGRRARALARPGAAAAIADRVEQVAGRRAA
ncbi:MAG TPA: glycosyltransferase [Thermoanaerobaculia bacterium]|nr:glycosyltransferase [Thermoanaerobaculia bacterium]